MKEDTKPADTLSPEIQDVVRNLVTAIRAVKIYPPNNPVYTQSVVKSHESLLTFFKTGPEFHVGVQKTAFAYQQTPIGRDAQLNKAIAQDLFTKGLREIVLSDGVTVEEMLELFRALALSSEEMAMKSGIPSILWEKGVEHIKVTEAGLDEVITTKTPGGWENKPITVTPAKTLEPTVAKQEISFSGRSLVLGDLMTDPAGFGASMVELAKKTHAGTETVEDRLLALYQEAGRKIHDEHSGQSATLFEGLAQSALALESPYRETLIGGKLYGHLDAELAEAHKEEHKHEVEEQLPNDMHEILTGRFSNAWTVEQVAVLLKKTATKASSAPAAPVSPEALTVAPLPADLAGLVQELSEYTPEEMEALKAMSEVGMESDIIEAAVRNLISLIPLVKNPRHAAPDEKEVSFFSSVIHQLEDIQSYLVKKKEYTIAGTIIEAFHMPVEPAFQPRMIEAKKKTASKASIQAAINDLQKHGKDSPEYLQAYQYASALAKETTEVLLEMLAEEKDRNARLVLLDLVKAIGKNQITLLGERLSDDRWYLVRNIVSVLGDSKTDQSIAFLRKAADHENVRIREEVIKGLLSIGGKKAAGVLAKFLRDKDLGIQQMAIQAFVDFPEISAEEAKPLIAFLEVRPLKKKEQDVTLAAIKALGKIGGKDAGEFLKGYLRIRWWRSRKLQLELRDAAQWAIEEIRRGQADARRAKG